MSAQLTIGLPTYSELAPPSWQFVVDLAVAADRAGVDRVTASDHVVFGERLAEYAKPHLGGVRGGTQPTGPDGQWLDPFTTLAVIAGRTSQIRVRTNILIAALRRPVVLAKSAATLDVLSGGRFDLGVGVGWQREEYDAAGLDFHRRGRLLDHTLEVCQTLWTQTRASYDAPELTFEGIHQMPKPTREQGVPVWVSGTIHPAVVERVARFGAGWIRWGDDAADPTGPARMKEALAAAGHDRPELQVTGILRPVHDDAGRLDVDATVAGVAGLVESGVTDIGMHLRLPEDPAAAEDLLRPLVVAFRAATGREQVTP
jgi:probable F420-dependent oxidoreductase